MILDVGARQVGKLVLVRVARRGPCRVQILMAPHTMQTLTSMQTQT